MYPHVHTLRTSRPSLSCFTGEHLVSMVQLSMGMSVGPNWFWVLYNDATLYRRQQVQTGYTLYISLSY